MMIMEEAPLLLGALQYIMVRSGSSAWGDRPGRVRCEMGGGTRSFERISPSLLQPRSRCNDGVVGRRGGGWVFLCGSPARRGAVQWCGTRQGTDCSDPFCAALAEMHGLVGCSQLKCQPAVPGVGRSVPVESGGRFCSVPVRSRWFRLAARTRRM